MSGIKYLDNEQFLQELIEHKNKCELALKNQQELPRISEFIGNSFLLLVNNISKKSDYSRYPEQVLEQMKSDAILNCIQYINSFDSSTSKNPFGYFTMLIHRAFWRRIEKERKRLYQKYKMIENSGILDEPGIFDDTEASTELFEMYDNITEFIKTYEFHEKRKKDLKKTALEKFFDE